MTGRTIWIYSSPANRPQAGELARTLDGVAPVLGLGPTGYPAPDLDLGPEPDLALALESCPADLRPLACVCLDARPPEGLDCLPCPVYGFAGGAGPEGELPPEPDRAAAALGESAQIGGRFPWARAVKVNLPLVDLLGRYRALATASGFDFEVGLQAESQDALGQAELAEAKELLKGRSLTAHMPFLDLIPASRDPLVARAARQRMETGAEWALYLGARQAVMHLGFDQRLHRDPEDFTERFVDNLGPVVERLCRAGCRVVLENVFEPGPEVLTLVRKALDPAGGVGYCLDVGHATAFSQTPLEGWWRALAEGIWELHLHDNDGSDDQHLPIGWGCIDWAFVRKSLAELPQAPVLTLEPHNEPHLWGSLRGLMRLWGEP